MLITVPEAHTLGTCYLEILFSNLVSEIDKVDFNWHFFFLSLSFKLVA